MSTPRAPRPRNSQVAKAAKAGQGSRNVWMIVAVVAVVAFAAIIALALSQEESTRGSETADVTVTGTPLPIQDPEGAVGMEAPELSGTSLDGEPLSITNDGRPKLIAFFAHWCPHCRAEVPVVQDWLDSGGLGDDADFYAVSTSVSPGQANYPPSKWFAQEDWTAPTLKDDAGSSAHLAYGAGNFPYWVTVNAKGEVVSTNSGELSVEAIEGLLALATSDSGDDIPDGATDDTGDDTGEDRSDESGDDAE